MDESEFKKMRAEVDSGKASLERHLSRDNFPPISEPWAISLYVGMLVSLEYADELVDDEPDNDGPCPVGCDPDDPQHEARCAAHEAREVEYKSLLGRFVIEWGGLEMTLDLLVLEIFRLCDVSPLNRGGRPPEVPRSLEARINFLKDAHRLIPELQPLRERAGEVLRRVTAVRKERHLLIHGVLRGVDLKGNATLIQMSYQNDGYSAALRRVTPKRLEQLVAHSRQSAVEVLRHTRFLLATFSARRSD